GSGVAAPILRVSPAIAFYGPHTRRKADRFAWQVSAEPWAGSAVGQHSLSPFQSNQQQFNVLVLEVEHLTEYLTGEHAFINVNTAAESRVVDDQAFASAGIAHFEQNG